MSKFESKTCSRCGGSGHYSFNLMHGTMCYGCSGSGIKYTKRGAEARRFYDESLTVPASELKVGMGIRENSGWKNFALIQAIDTGTDYELGQRHITSYSLGEAGKRQMILADTGRSKAKFLPDYRVRVMHTDAEKKVKIQAALEYQATLNANGTVSKRKTKVKA
jgi:hypothetical protein